MSSKGSSPAGSTTTTTTPWTAEQPYLQQGYNAASQLLNTGGQQYYPGQQVAPFSPLQEQAFGQVQNLASAPNTVNQSGSNYYNALMGGQFLSPQNNPALQGLVNQSEQQIQNNLASQFAGAGRNIEASAPVQASQMGNIANQIYGGAYNNALNNMTSGLGQGNNLIAGQYMPEQALMGAGNQIQQQAQNIIGGNMNQWAFNQAAPWNALGAYTSAMGGLPMGQQQSVPYFTNPMAGAAGGAMLGYEMGGNSPWGAGIGGLLGYLGSGG